MHLWIDNLRDSPGDVAADDPSPSPPCDPGVNLSFIITFLSYQFIHWR